MSECTEGPWGYDSNVGVIHGTPRYGSSEQTGIGGEFQGAETNALNEVCTVRRVRVYDFTMSGSGAHYPVKKEIEQRLSDRMKANARLIVAAPDLLQKLKELVDACDGNYQELTEECRAVIDKAEGR